MPKMKLLVLAQVPPPVHGQSIMIATLVTGLPGEGIAVEHVNLRLSRDAADIGAIRPAKFLAVVDACLQAIAARLAGRANVLYYVPAPGKRGAVWRDCLVMLLCRPFFPRLVLHWHATGLAGWLETKASAAERALTRRLLGGASLAIVLGAALRNDAAYFGARQIRVVANGVRDVPPGPRIRNATGARFEVLFLGLCCAEKGLFDATAAVLSAGRAEGGVRFRLTAAGDFPDDKTRRRFLELCAAHPGEINHAGFVAGEAKARLLATSDCLCLPTKLPHEGQPLVVLEALAADLPVIASDWRGIPEILPHAASRVVPPGDIPALAAALLDFARNPPAAGVAREHFERNFTIGRHVGCLATALGSI